MTLGKAKILFIGNSFTQRNDLPALLAGLAATADKGTQVESELVAAGGASLRQHLNKGTAGLLLAEGGWDYVVLQEQSTLPIKNPKRTQENIRDFHGIIADSGARTVLYMTWAR
ncbi:MAG: SGNH/GDSL hydrolase family protein, partial [bacterium]|nr:SGNH/GDSL hydrolase family protein [bacterium]